MPPLEELEFFPRHYPIHVEDAEGPLLTIQTKPSRDYFLRPGGEAALRAMLENWKHEGEADAPTAG